MKGVDLATSVTVLLSGVYYFYHNSAKQRKNLQTSAMATKEPGGRSSVIPTRVSGTRWVAHLHLAICNFISGYKAIATHLADVVLHDFV